MVGDPIKERNVMKTIMKKIAPVFVATFIAICSLGLFGCSGDGSIMAAMPADTSDEKIQECILNSSEIQSTLGLQEECNDPTEFEIIEFSCDELTEGKYRVKATVKNNIIAMEIACDVNKNNDTYECKNFKNEKIVDVYSGPTKFNVANKELDQYHPDFSKNEITKYSEGIWECKTPSDIGYISSKIGFGAGSDNTDYWKPTIPHVRSWER